MQAEPPLVDPSTIVPAVLADFEDAKAGRTTGGPQLP